MRRLRPLLRHVPQLLLIAAVAGVVSVRHLNEPPAYIHAWAQADNYGLALGFLHNGGNLLHPNTMIFNKQQYDFDLPPSAVTACDLPLHHWVVAALMRLTGSHEPWVFRGWTLAVTILGLWALYFLALLLARSRARATLVAVVTATAPSFAYYSASFLPTSPALALASGGLLAYALHVRRGSTGALHASLLLLTLAVLTRSSMAVLWVAVAAFHLLRLLRGEVGWRSSWLPFLLGVALYAAWQGWNLHLRQRYGSMFLGRLMPVRGADEVAAVWQNVHDHWCFHYFQRLQHWLYVAVAAGAAVWAVVRRRRGASAPQARKLLSPWWLLAIWAFGELLFVGAMLLQFRYHDYYFLDSLFLPLVLLLAGLLGLLPDARGPWQRGAEWAVLLVLAGLMTAQACRMQRERRLEGIEALDTAVRYKGANRLLAEAGVDRPGVRLLSLFTYPQSIAFDMMNRQGYAVMWNDTAVVGHALGFGFDYILVEDTVYRQLFPEAGYILPRLRRLAGDGQLSLCSLADSALHPTADHFFSSAELQEYWREEH